LRLEQEKKDMNFYIYTSVYYFSFLFRFFFKLKFILQKYIFYTYVDRFTIFLSLFMEI